MSSAKTSPLDWIVGLFSSLKLTIVCLAFGVFLIFWGTIEQARLGIDQAVETYLRSFIVWWSPAGASWRIPILPGGFLVGGVLLVNLIAAHLYRFRLGWRKSGIWLVHIGLIVLLLGELITAVFQRDSFMRLSEGETKAYSESHRVTELAIIDRSDPATDKVVAIPEKLLESGGSIQDPHLPFRVEVRAYFANSHVTRRGADPDHGGSAPLATQGLGLQFAAHEIPRTGKQDERDIASAWFELIGPEGSLGTWMVCDVPLFEGAQSFTYNGKSYAFDLRPQRFYKPYRITLLDFTHDRYPGTDKPRDFASLVRLVDPRQHEDREVRIYMNHPLRYDGLTFYQHSFEVGDTTTILQVVRNPGRHLPYISCVLVGLGLLVQFGIHLFGFSKRSRQVAPARASRVPWIAMATAAVLIAVMVLRPESSGKIHWREFGKLPVLVGGRIKPIDTVARTSLLLIHDKQTLALPEGGKLSANEWLAEVLFAPERAAARKVFTIHDPQVIGLLGRRPDDGKYFSLDELRPHVGEIVRQAQLADAVEPKLRSLFQRHVLDLYQQLDLFQRLWQSAQPVDAPDFATEVQQFERALPALGKMVEQRQANAELTSDDASALAFIEQRYAQMAELAYLRLVPPTNPADVRDRTAWANVGEAMLTAARDGSLHPAVPAYAQMGAAYRATDIAAFDSAIASFTGWLRQNSYQPELTKTAREVFFNRYAPFYVAMVLYVAVFVLGCVSWLTGPGNVRRTAFLLTALALLIHTSGIAFRMILEGRPPVTNLYSSAVFVGYVAVVIAFLLERLFRNGIGSVVAGTIGFCTLLIAHHLSLAGDTMEMMQAVLDSNFWLATHVVVITVGYGSTFLAGFLALVYITLGLFTRLLQPDLARSLNRMVYGVVCFATLGSFVGTVLGGIWADQSWGRFWGWDPKENGAALIVLWNAIILHARWGGYIRERGLMVMAVGGNIVTSWSWFGTNMLGIGLHSYGFMDKAFIWLMVFVGSQLAMMALASLPLEKWRSPLAAAAASARKIPPGDTPLPVGAPAGK